RPGQRWPPIVDVLERGHVDVLSPPHQHAWRTALDVYQRQVIIRDLVFDAVLRTLRHRLSHMDRAEVGTAPVLVAQILAALRAAMPIYRAYWWDAHDAANRQWMTQVLGQGAEAEAWLASRLAHVYGGPWPAEPIRVDLTAYASWQGAYTTH